MSLESHPEVARELATALPAQPTQGHNLATSISPDVWFKLIETLGPLIVSIIKAIFAAFPAPTPAPAPTPTTAP